jgi:putative sterol carrier protein
MQIESTAAYFECLAASGYQPLLHQVTGTLRFDIDQNDGRQCHWNVTIDHGNLSVDRDEDRHGTNGAVPPADCTLAANEDEFLRILSGQESLAAAYVRGAITIEGDHTLAQDIRRFSPPADVYPDVLQHADPTSTYQP